MAQSDSTAADVDLLVRDAQNLHVSQSDRGESFVDFEEVDVGLAYASARERLGEREGGGGGEVDGRLFGIGVAADECKGLQAEGSSFGT
jgi:hypothetical protein